MIPITILTGFLGSGKTTFLNKLIKQNPNIRFGMIINEFGEVGIDAQLVEQSGEEIVEMSNGCMCCVVRKDLLETVDKLLETKKIDYILIETSGLAEPRPIAETFAMDDRGGRVMLDGVVCMLDAENYELTQKNYTVAMEQLQFCDIVVLNKISKENPTRLQELQKIIKEVNPLAAVVENYLDSEVDSKLIIDTGKWSIEKLAEKDGHQEHEHQKNHAEHNHNHEENSEHNEHEHEADKHEHHHTHKHEHEEVDEVVFKSEKPLDPNKLDNWLQNQMPPQVIRAKGILQIKSPQTNGFFVFQMVGAAKTLLPFEVFKKEIDLSFSRIVLIGKNLPKDKILQDLEKCVA